MSRIHCLKYQKYTTTNYKDIMIRKFEFVASNILRNKIVKDKLVSNRYIKVITSLKFKFSSPYIFTTWWYKPLIFQDITS